MKFERIYDKTYITRCFTAPHVWRMSPDNIIAGIDPDFYFPTLSDDFFWLKAGGYGLFLLDPRGLYSYEVHVVLNKHARGKAVEIAKQSLAWVFSHTQAHYLTATIPTVNVLARRLARQAGMIYSGVSEETFEKDGQQHAQHLYTIYKD